QAVFDKYPDAAQKKVLQLRQWILECAGDKPVDETLKWGEPSYRCKGASPVRLGVREAPVLSLCLFFNCQSQLVETFRELYSDDLSFDGNRAIVLPANKKLPATEVKHCITLALEYHQRKHLPMLGA
ncbi:MAG: DUF1801 domain-containing protein, partial [Pseudomonadota bacterium]